ncbi:constitutive coactivator of PPAR-gamma-like protein 1 homolog [Amphibalanus amphitrite]|uniref:constitutive coactivator of PPAR-gamma-like protein 1 homolog n=1 Tax=Amphibalanus amphitrite TaxID=1232801 RepID=UPI001C903848|nr:constitutive coactivator of PPAR-gamma-like protein 1 homolog [Amphibalanus amphitrite]
MGIQELQRYIEVHAPSACVPVDLLKLARGVTLGQPRTPSARRRPPPAVQLCLVLDAESCLDRLYGGFFSDWACGGEWGRMMHFLTVLIQTIRTNNMELAVFFSGALELPRMREWVGRQHAQRRHINQTLKHLSVKATPPPKVWWTAPACLRSALRLALRSLDVQVLCSTDEHRQEVMAFCHENSYHGLVAEDAEFIMLNPPRLFSARQLKLTYKGTLETKEFILQQVARGLDLQPNRFSLLAALLGNFLLTDQDLADFHESLLQASQARAEPPGTPAAPDADAALQLQLVGAVLQFVRSLPSVDRLDAVGERVFGDASDPRVARLKESVAYFGDGSRDGYFRHKSLSGALNGSCSVLAAERSSDAGGGSLSGPPSVPSDPGSVLDVAPAAQTRAGGRTDEQADCLARRFGLLGLDMDAYVPGTAPGSYSDDRPANGHSSAGAEGPAVTLTPPPLPPVTAEVLRTAGERHRRGLMTPWVYQVLTKGELKVPVCVEDELNRELPNAVLFFRPARERIYGVLFNLYHHSYLSHRDRDKPEHERHAVPRVQIREWVYSRSNPYRRPELVPAQPLGWGVPTVQRLWFGTSEDDKKRRLRAFLSCLQSDTPTIRNTVYVPEHLLVLACVLRFILSQTSGSQQPSIYKPELDAFIAQALCPKLADTQYLQELQLPAVTPRGVQLGNLFMQGVETALFANDACGAPIPWAVCCPWLFFDGKLFHSYLLKAAQSRNVTQLCDDRVEMVAQLEMTRQAVLEGLPVQYGRPPLLSAAPAPAPAPAQVYGRSSLPKAPSRRPYTPSGKKQQARWRGADGLDSDSEESLLPAGRAMTVDLPDTREVGDASLGGSGSEVPGQYQDAPLLHVQ